MKLSICLSEFALTVFGSFNKGVCFIKASNELKREDTLFSESSKLFFFKRM